MFDWKSCSLDVVFSIFDDVIFLNGTPSYTKTEISVSRRENILETKTTNKLWPEYWVSKSLVKVNVSEMWCDLRTSIVFFVLTMSSQGPQTETI